MNSARDGSTGKQEQRRRRERDIGDYITEEPLTSLAIAGAAGFIVGGGANSKIGLAALAMVGKIALRGAATNFIIGLIFPDPNRTTPKHAKFKRRYRDEKHGNARHDNRRTDFQNPG